MHRGRGATREHYETVEEALSGALEAALGERWDTPTAHAWRRLYRLMAETMSKAQPESVSSPQR